MRLILELIEDGKDAELTERTGKLGPFPSMIIWCVAPLSTYHG